MKHSQHNIVGQSVKIVPVEVAATSMVNLVAESRRKQVTSLTALQHIAYNRQKRHHAITATALVRPTFL